MMNFFFFFFTSCKFPIKTTFVIEEFENVLFFDRYFAILISYTRYGLIFISAIQRTFDLLLLIVVAQYKADKTINFRKLT